MLFRALLIWFFSISLALARYTEGEWRDDVDYISYSKTSFFENFLISYFCIGLLCLLFTYADKNKLNDVKPYSLFLAHFIFAIISALFMSA